MFGSLSHTCFFGSMVVPYAYCGQYKVNDEMHRKNRQHCHQFPLMVPKTTYG